MLNRSVFSAIGASAKIGLAALGLTLGAGGFAQAEPQEMAPTGPQLVQVAESPHQWTGIAVSRSGRVFVNFPRWSTGVPMSVGELDTTTGKVRPYPDETFNNWLLGQDPKAKFVCVQSVYIDRKDRLWILDPANPMFGGVVEGGVKLMQVDLDRNKLVRTYYFDDMIAPGSSYLNDVRVDTKTETAYITDSGLGAIIVLDMASGVSRRLLADHPSTKAEPITLQVQNRPLAIEVHSDGIALDEKNEWLYFQALTGRTMYRVQTKELRDPSRSPEDLADKVKVFASSGVSDGLFFAHDGIFVSAIEEDAIKRVDSKGRVFTLVQDPRISWPDSFALGSDGSVWFTTSQIHLGLNPDTPYRIFKFRPVID